MNVYPQLETGYADGEIPRAVAANIGARQRFNQGPDIVPEPIDLVTLINLIGTDKSRHRMLFESFKDSTPQIVDELQVALQERAGPCLGQLAHKLKSSAMSVGATELANICQALESAGKNDQWPDIERLAPVLMRQITRVTDYMNDYCHPENVLNALKKSAAAMPRVLLLDDDSLALKLGRMVLDQMGVKDILAVDSGEEALMVLQRQDDAIDVILCDLNMPGMDGLEFLRFLAEQNYPGALLLISGEDAGIMKMSVKLAKKRGLNVLGALAKPISSVKLDVYMDAVVKERPEKESVQAPGTIASLTAEELQRGIENDELMAYFQPKLDINSREIIGLETLVRWQHPERGIVAPYEFVAIAERHGLINALTAKVLEQALGSIADLRATGYDLKVAVNLSVDTLTDLEWPDYAASMAKEFGVNPSSIIFEVTETGLVGDMATALEILTRLRMKGFTLSVDDFGTGYASMEQLLIAPFSELKIDRSFVNGALADPAIRVILESCVGMAKRLNMNIVAEGVETQEEFDMVARLGCDQMQGYFVARPMPFSELVAWLQRWQR